MKPLFRSTDVQDTFEQNGFVKVPLLTTDEARHLLGDYAKVAREHEALGIPYVTTSHSNDAALIRKVDGFLQKVLAPAIGQHMTGHRLLFGNFLVKMPMDGSETAPHQDITFVDEQEFTSVNIWVALQDTDEENGCMYFLPGSHRFMHTIRPTHSYPWAYEKVSGELKRQAVAFPCKAGEAFIFHHGTIHGSFPNRTKTPRLAAVMAAYQADAPLLHYYLPEGRGNRLWKYGMDKAAFLSFVKNKPPGEGVFIGEVEYDFPQVDVDTLNAMLKKNVPTQKSPNGISKLLKIFR